jgi:hypothetical protein
MPTSYESDRPSEETASRRPPVRLSLSPEVAPGRFHGAWWPRSRDLRVELPILLAGLPDDHGPARSVVHSGSDWARVPQATEVGGQVVEVTASSDRDAGTITVTVSTHDLVLLVVPPDASAADAAKAMERASAPVHQTWDDGGPSWWSPHPVAPSYRLRHRGSRQAAPRAANGREAGPSTIEFLHEGNDYTGCGSSGRVWRISPELTGWRLEFRDTGDLVATNAGVHRSVEAAMTEARR